MFFANQYNSKSQEQCTGDEVFTSYTFTYESCSYTIDLCVSCSVTAPGNVRFAGLHYDLEQTDCMDNDAQIQQIISGELNNPNFVFFLMEPCITQGGAPPCDDNNPYEFELNWAYCYYYIDAIVETYSGPKLHRFGYPCEDDVYCTEKISVCIEENPPPGDYQITRSSPTIEGSGTQSCTKMHHEVTPQPPYTPSECFKIISNPCPWPTE